MSSAGRPRLGIVAMAVLMVAAACNPFGGDSAPPTTTAPPTTQPPSRAGASIDGVVKIGAVLPLSGDLSRFGPGMQAAVELAVDEVNDAGGLLGKPVELFIEDSASTAQGATAAARKLIDASLVDGIVGPPSSIELTPGVLDAATEGERVVCSPAAGAPHRGADDEKNLLFTMVPADNGQNFVITDVLKKAGRNRIAVVRGAADDEAFLAEDLMSELEDAFGAGGFEIVADVTLDAAGEASPAATAEQLKAASPQAVAILLRPSQGAPLLKAMFEAGLLPSQGADVMVVVGDKLASEDLAAAVDANTPTILNQVQGVRPDPAGPLITSDFDRRFRARTAIEDVEFAGQAYDCAILLALSAAAAGSDDPVAMTSTMVDITNGTFICLNFPACADVLRRGDPITYFGATGISFGGSGDPDQGDFEHFRFDDRGRIIHLANFEVFLDAEGGSAGAPTATPPTTVPTSSPSGRDGGAKTTTTISGVLGGTTTTTAPGGATTTTAR